MLKNRQKMKEIAVTQEASAADLFLNDLFYARTN